MQQVSNNPAPSFHEDDTVKQSVALRGLGYGAIGVAAGGILGSYAMHPHRFNLTSTSALASAALLGGLLGGLGVWKANKQNAWVDSVDHYRTLDQSGQLRDTSIAPKDLHYLQLKNPTREAWTKGITTALLWTALDLTIFRDTYNDFRFTAGVDALLFGAIDAASAHSHAMQHNHRGDIIRHYMAKGRNNAVEQQAASQSHTERLDHERTQSVAPGFIQPR